MGISQHHSLLTLQEYVGLNHPEPKEGGRGVPIAGMGRSDQGLTTAASLRPLEKTQFS